MKFNSVVLFRISCTDALFWTSTIGLGTLVSRYRAGHEGGHSLLM